MRFVIAIVLFVVALAAIGVGIAQRTLWQGPDSFTAQVTTEEAPVTVIDGAALNAFPGTQSVIVSGSDQIFLAYGRTTDVVAWVGDASYNEIGWDAETQELTSTHVEGTEDTVPSPAGSDLWNQELTGQGELTRRINVPADISVIVVADGTQPAPTDIALRWPLDNSTPLSSPLIIGGIVTLLLGLVAFIWALHHTRRRRGPRRKLPRAPQPPRLKRAPQRKAITTGAGVLMVGALLAGCTTGGVPAPTPTPTGTAAALADVPPVAVTVQQADKIVDKVREAVTAADAASDATAAGTRLAGPALALRTANYTARAADGGIAAVPAIPEGDVELVLPQQTDTWPRSFVAVLAPADTTIAPITMLLEQDSPRDPYKAHFVVSLDANVEIAAVAPAQIGASVSSPDNKFGILQPGQLAEAYGEILRSDTEAPQYALFQADGDSLRTQIGKAAKDARAASIPASGKIAFSGAADPEPPVSFATNDSGQLVFTALDDIETVTPVEAGAAINPEGSIKALSGLSQSTKGVTATYGVQMLFYVPPATEGDAGAQIQLLGFAQGLIAAAEVAS